MKTFKTYNDFKEFLAANKIHVSNQVEDLYGDYKGSEYVYVRENVRGASGGSCYNDENNGAEEYENDPPTYDLFDNIIGLVFTNKEYDKRVKEIHSMVMTDKYHSSEYYGNYSNYEYLILDIKEYYNTILSVKEQRKAKLKEIGIT